MKCPECGVDMMIYRASVTGDGTVEREMVCRNPRCGLFDRRLSKRPATDEDNDSQSADA